MKKHSFTSHSIALVVLLLLSPLTLFSANTVTINNIKYTLGGDTAVVNGCASEPIGDLVIPSTVELSGVTYRVTSVDDYAFYMRIGLTSVSLPSSLSSIGKSAFLDCEDLKEYIVSANSPYFAVQDGILFDKAMKKLILYPTGREASEYTVPSIVESISDWAFFSCNGLTRVSFSDSLRSLGERTFSNCDGLTEVTLPAGLSHFGSWAFSYCDSLKRVTFPAELSCIGESAFRYCKGLQEFVVSANNQHFAAQDGVLFDKTMKELLYYPRGGWMREYILPPSVETIDNYAFWNCVGLTSVTLSDSLRSIGENAFLECSKLESVTFPDSLRSIGNRAFFLCSDLTAITLPTGLSSLGESVFYGCFDLASVTLPAGLASIGESTFGNCSSLTRVTLPNSLSRIGNNAFSFCTDLTCVTLSAGLCSLGEKVFASCKNLRELHVPIATPLEVISSTFYDLPTSACSLYVPVGSRVAYQAANYWCDFYNIVEEDIEASGTINTSESRVRIVANAGRIVVEGAPRDAVIAIYTLSGQLIANTTNTEIEIPQQRGVYIVRVGEESFKVNL